MYETRELKWFLKLVSGPVNEPVTFEDAMNHLRVTDMEVLISELIMVARQHIDGRDGWLGRALITQTWELNLDAFPCGFIRVPLPPLQEVISIKYTDEAGVEQTLDPTKYRVIESEPAEIVPAYGLNWPATRCERATVRIRFKAGYGDNPSSVPKTVKQAMLLLVGHYYENREIIITGATVEMIPQAVDALLMPLRISWL